MSGTKSTSFYFLDRKISINVIEEETPLNDAFLEVSPIKEYNLTFTKKGAFTTKVVIHETWHLFFDILASFNEESFSFSELSKEIYTYAFETLYSKIKENLEILC